MPRSRTPKAETPRAERSISDHTGDPATPPAADSTLRTRRRFARRQWARRFGAWRWAFGLVVIVGLAGTAVWLVFFSAVLAVEDVTVTGTGYLSVSDVEQIADIPLGEPLARLDLVAIRQRVEATDSVKSARVVRSWPHGVRIEVTERQPVAVVDVGGQIRGLDSDGEIFREYARLPRDLPLVRISLSADLAARKEVAGVVASLPDALARRVDHVTVESIDQISLELRDGRSVVWGSAENSAEKVRVLEALLLHDAQEYDISIPGQPTTRG